MALRFLTHGSFVYFGQEANVLGVNVVESAESVAHTQVVQFGSWEKLSVDNMASLEGRWHPVVLPGLRALGAESYAWVLPDEVAAAPLGGFAYMFSPELHSKLKCYARLYPIDKTSM